VPFDQCFGGCEVYFRDYIFYDNELLFVSWSEIDMQLIRYIAIAIAIAIVIRPFTFALMFDRWERFL